MLVRYFLRFMINLIALRFCRKVQKSSKKSFILEVLFWTAQYMYAIYKATYAIVERSLWLKKAQPNQQLRYWVGY